MIEANHSQMAIDAAVRLIRSLTEGEGVRIDLNGELGEAVADFLRDQAEYIEQEIRGY